MDIMTGDDLHESDDDDDFDSLVTQIEQEVQQLNEEETISKANVHNSQNYLDILNVSSNLSKVIEKYLPTTVSCLMNTSMISSKLCMTHSQVNDMPDELLSRVMCFAPVSLCTRVCHRWATLQTKLVRERCVEAFIAKADLSKTLSGEVEDELFIYCDRKASSQYQKRARSLLFNLRDNVDLKGTLVAGDDMTPKDFVRLSSTQMANKGLIAKQSEWRTRSLEEAKRKRPLPHMTTSAFTCPSCTHGECIYYQWRRKPILDRVHLTVQCLECKFRWEP
eukprot:gene854-1661_t